MKVTDINNLQPNSQQPLQNIKKSLYGTRNTRKLVIMVMWHKALIMLHTDRSIINNRFYIISKKPSAVFRICRHCSGTLKTVRIVNVKIHKLYKYLQHQSMSNRKESRKQTRKFCTTMIIVEFKENNKHHHRGFTVTTIFFCDI